VSVTRRTAHLANRTCLGYFEKDTYSDDTKAPMKLTPDAWSV
jgi:hypothetical protein